MKKSIYTFALTTLIVGVITTGCQSSAQKEEAAKEEVTEAKEDLKEVQKDANA